MIAQNGSPGLEVDSVVREAEPLVDRFDIAYILRRYLGVFVVVPVICGLIGIVWFFLRPALYESSALIYIDPKFDEILRLEKFEGDGPPDLDSLSSLEIMIVADTMVLRVVDELKLREAGGFLPARLVDKPQLSDKELVTFLQRHRFSAKLLEGTRLIEICVRDPDPGRAQLIAGAFASGFDEFLVGRRQDEAKRARATLEVQVVEAREAALAAEEKSREFRVAHPQFPMEQDHDMFAARLTQFSADLNTVESLRMDLQSQVEFLAEVDPAATPLVVFKISGDESSQTVSDLLGQRASSGARLAVAKEEMLTTDYHYLALASEYARHEEQLREMAQEIKAAVQSKFEATLSREKALRAQLEGIQRELVEVKSLSSEFRVLHQQAERAWLVYENLQNHLSESEVAMDSHSNIATEVSQPLAPYKRAGLSGVLLLAITAGVGTMLSMAWVGSQVLIGLPYTDRSQLQWRFRLPVVADWTGKNAFPARGGDAVFLQALGAGAAKTMQITAIGRPGLGESVAAAIAQMAARAGAATLLVVLNSKPVENGAPEKPKSTGTDRLMRLDASIRAALTGQALETYLREHQQHFGHIFLATADCEDPAIVAWLSTLAEKNIIVVEKGAGLKREVDLGVESLTARGMPPVGIILSDPGACPIPKFDPGEPKPFAGAFDGRGNVG